MSTRVKPQSGVAHEIRLAASLPARAPPHKPTIRRLPWSAPRPASPRPTRSPI